MPERFVHVVKDKRLHLDVAILDIDSLHLHEETIPELLEDLAYSIEANGFVKHPIIVDHESLVVLDGTHRVAALTKLGIRRVPACVVGYKNPNIRVCSWYRTVTGVSTPEQILGLVAKAGSVARATTELDEGAIGVSPTVAVIQFRNVTYTVDSSFRNLGEAYRIIGCIEELIRGSGMRVEYETERDALKSLRQGSVDAVICTPRLGKDEIINAALSGQVLASKATRHVVPARVMGLNVSLKVLRDEKVPISEVNDELKRMLQKRHLKRIPSGSVLDGRRYEEELYVFEE